MENLRFESVGWDRLNYSSSALDSVSQTLRESGLPFVDLDIAIWKSAFLAYTRLPHYQGEYKTYGGTESFCFLEKALEHFLSIVLTNPCAGQIAIDVGSCKSVVPELMRDIYGAVCFEQDLAYPSGVNGNRIGGSASDIPLGESSVDLLTLHCTFEHFEGDHDIGFVKECGRLLRPGGKAIILPFYLNPTHVNVTGESEEGALASIGWDGEAEHYCIIPTWQNRFGRHYSPAAFKRRILATAATSGLSPVLYRVRSLSSLDERMWLRWVLVLEKK